MSTPTDGGGPITQRLSTDLTVDAVYGLVRPLQEEDDATGVAQSSLPVAGFYLPDASHPLPKVTRLDGSEPKVAYVGVFREYHNTVSLGVDAYQASVKNAREGVLPRLADREARFSQRDLVDVLRTTGGAEAWLGTELAMRIQTLGEVEEKLAEQEEKLKRAQAWMLSTPLPSGDSTCLLCNTHKACTREGLPALATRQCKCKDQATGKRTYFMCHTCAVKNHILYGKCPYCTGAQH